jgi:hypothetical protein
MRFALPRLLRAGVVALPLASCQQPTAPVVAPAAPPPPVMSHRPLAANWSFRAGDVCTATAGAALLALDVNASRDTLELVARVDRAPLPESRFIPMKFVGPSGAWSVIGRRTAAGRVIASEPMTEDQAGRILILLGGGIVTIGNRDLGPPPLRIPNAGPPGRDWFECVRRQLFP